MNEIAFAAYLLETLLHEVFHSKRRMARELGVTLRTLQLNMKSGENSKGANRATILSATKLRTIWCIFRRATIKIEVFPITPFLNGLIPVKVIGLETLR